MKTRNIREIAAAGADTFVAGSAIFGSDDYAATIATMKAEIAAAVEIAAKVAPTPSRKVESTVGAALPICDNVGENVKYQPHQTGVQNSDL